MSVVIDLSGLDRMLSAGEVKRRQTEYAMRAALVMTDYVPIDEDILRPTVWSNSKFESGLLIWNTPYAAKQYYVPMNHPKAGTDHWDEACWKEKGDDLLKYAESLYGGY